MTIDLTRTELNKRLKRLQMQFKEGKIGADLYFEAIQKLNEGWVPKGGKGVWSGWKSKEAPFPNCGLVRESLTQIANKKGKEGVCTYLKEQYMSDERDQARDCTISIMSDLCENMFKEAFKERVIPYENDEFLILKSLEKYRLLTQSDEERIRAFRDMDDLIKAETRLGKRYFHNKYGWNKLRKMFREY